jgi:hypothetical protein
VECEKIDLGDLKNQPRRDWETKKIKLRDQKLTWGTQKIDLGEQKTDL